jgi:hypothetical protein
MTIDEQVDLGNRAGRAYITYFKAYADDRYEGLYERFKETDDLEEMLAIKAELKAIKTVESDLLTAIDTGRLAQLQLNRKL